METPLFIDINPDALKELANYPEDQPVHMLNLLKYKERDETSGKTGREIYTSYMAAAPISNSCLRYATAHSQTLAIMKMNFLNSFKWKDTQVILENKPW